MKKTKGNFITIQQVVKDFTDQEAAQRKFDELNNEIKWRDPSEQSYDGCELNFIRLDGFGLYEY